METGMIAAAENIGDSADQGNAREVVVVDMDRTLLVSDMTLENALGVVGHKPWKIPAMIGWAMKGRAVLKARLAETAMPSLAHVPVNPEVVAYVEARRSAGAKTVLASASSAPIVTGIARQTGLFDEAYGATEANNFKGEAKADFLDATYGKGGYTYVGDSPSDLKVWSRAGHAVTVGASPSLRRQAEAVAPGAEHLDVASRGMSTWLRGVIKAIRPHQWSKNALIFVPLLAAQALTGGTILAAILAFIVFSLTASSVYILNDMLDLDSDRSHPRKRLRPFASGIVPIKDGLKIAPLLLFAAVLLAVLFLPPSFLIVLPVYFVATTSYSLWLKRKVMVDVFLLAGLYTVRIIAGGEATGVPMSPWLIAFAIFFFLCLAIVKRMAEIVDIARNDKARQSKRDYGLVDLPMVQSLGAAAGFGSILILVAYFTSPDATSLYRSPEYLWGIGPLMLFWVSRILVLANRGHVDDDPIVFAAKDRTSLAVGAIVVLIIMAAEYLPWLF